LARRAAELQKAKLCPTHCEMACIRTPKEYALIPKDLVALFRKKGSAYYSYKQSYIS